MDALYDLQTASGAQWNRDHGTPILTSFGNDDQARQAVETGVALCDRSHWGRIRVSGGDRLRFLHNQTTNAFQGLQPGQGCETVLVTSTARTIDLVSAFVEEDSVLLLTSPGQSAALIAWMDRFIFFADKVTLADVTEQTACFSLMGAAVEDLCDRLGITNRPETPHAHQTFTLQNQACRLAKGSGLASPGYTLWCDRAGAENLWTAIAAAGAIPFGQQLWEELRIQQGRPMPASELTEDYNPLEAGLWHTLSFTKGCYIGQETIARLDTYKGVKQQLWGVHLSEWVEPGSLAMVGEERVGVLTSAIATPQGIRGLVYIRTKAGGAGLTVHIGSAQGIVVDLPFLTRDRLA